MDGFRTVGQPAAVAALRSMLASRVPHAVLLVGPPSVGKASLADDLAAGLLCTGAVGGDRPCRACRGCRLVEHGNHPDLHRLAPEGPGGQIRIGASQQPGTARWLVARLALMPVEGGERVAIVPDAQRLNDDAQSALLKTLEEPPPATTLVLCADDEERLLPTVRSRCARVRLGAVGPREIERLLADRGLADAPTAARLARVAAGRPGIAVAYATATGAEPIRAEIVRTLLDLLAARPAVRLAAGRTLVARALELAELLAAATADATGEPAPEPRRAGRGRAAAGRAGRAAAAEPGPSPDDAAHGDPGPESAPAEPAGRVAAADRRRAVGLLLDAWREVARDLALVERGSSAVRDPDLLEELEAAARRLAPGSAVAALARLVRARELLDGNVSPELVLDTMLLAWPRRADAA